MRRTLQVLILTFLTSCVVQHVAAVERGFEFSGVVDFVFLGDPPAMPFGLPLDDETVVIGRFIYETTSPATHDFPGDVTGYRQQHTNGFWAEFDGMRVQADDYSIEIANDVNNPNFGTINDVVSIRFSSDLSPALELPLLVNGIPEVVAQFSIAFFASSDLYSDTSLPGDLDPATFSLPLFANVLSDQILPASRLAIFTLDSFAPISVLSSDHDLDSDVDGHDFLIWQRNFGLAVQNGDSNSDFQVDDLDLTAWQVQYGSFGSAMQVVAVPEPAMGVLLWVLFLLVWEIIVPRKRHAFVSSAQLFNRFETT